MKVLLLPSWYPNRKNPSVGSFFREQAALLHTAGFEMRILFGERHCVSRLNILKKKVKRRFGKESIRPGTDFLLQEPDAFSFPIPECNEWNDEKKYYNICHVYTCALEKMIEDGWRPDLIHAQCTVDGGLVAAHLSRVLGIPYVIIEHQVFLLKNYSFFKQERIVNALQRARKVGAVSHHQQRCILMNGIHCRSVITWNFVNERLFQIMPGEKSKVFRILTITYPGYIKDPETFFRSMAGFATLCNTPFEIVIIGNASFTDLEKADTTELEGLARKYNVYDNCIFIPHLSREEVAEIMNTAHVFVSTSIAETFGVAVREAMLCGLPVVTTASGGVEDTVNEKNGVVVHIGDHLAIAQGLLRIWSGELSFDPDGLRRAVISQCGEKAFLSVMNSFYSPN